VGLGHGEFGAVLEAVGNQLQARPEQRDWTDYTVFVARASA
jgi:hypothetical protein